MHGQSEDILTNVNHSVCITFHSVHKLCENRISLIWPLSGPPLLC